MATSRPGWDRSVLGAGRSSSARLLARAPLRRVAAWIDVLNAVPIEFGVGGQRCRWLTWGCTTGRCRDRVSHVHSFFEACYVVRGRGSFELKEQRHAVRRGQLFLSRPGQTHQIMENEPQGMAIVYWSLSLTPGTSSEASDADDAMVGRWMPQGPAVASASDQLALTLDMLLAEASRPRAGMSLAVRSLAARLLVETVRLTSASTPAQAVPPRHPRNPRYAQRLTQLAQQFIRDNQTRPIGVVDVARQVHLSPRHLARLFRAEVGCTVVQYLATQRMEKAKDLLLGDPGMAIKQVAAACGYKDVKHFSHLFTREVGLPPARFRDQGGTRYL